MEGDGGGAVSPGGGPVQQQHNANMTNGSNTPDDGLGVTRRYLMQDSKINSTLKLSIYMKHIEGTRDYYAPPLRTAPVFGGIAGIISTSEPTPHPPASAANTVTAAGGGMHSVGMGDVNHPGAELPTLSTMNRENGEMQDMYRRSLAAFWASQPGELKADECIEDIFSGGDGWGKSGRPKPFSLTDDENDRDGGGETEGTPPNPSPGGPGGRRHGHHHREAVHQHRHTGSAGSKGLSGIVAAGRTEGRETGPGPIKGQGELDEGEVREDLRSWRIGERAFA
jgi:hypothetical protein